MSKLSHARVGQEFNKYRFEKNLDKIMSKATSVSPTLIIFYKSTKLISDGSSKNLHSKPFASVFKTYKQGEYAHKYFWSATTLGVSKKFYETSQPRSWVYDKMINDNYKSISKTVEFIPHFIYRAMCRTVLLW